MSVSICSLQNAAGFLVCSYWGMGTDILDAYDPVLLLAYPYSRSGEGGPRGYVLNPGYINTGEKIGYGDRPCNQLGADGYVLVLPDQIKQVHYEDPDDPEWSYDYWEIEGLSDWCSPMQGLRGVVNLNTRKGACMSSQMSYYIGVGGKHINFHRTLGYQWIRGMLWIWSSNGPLVYQVKGYGMNTRIRQVGEGVWPYWTLDDLERTYPSSAGYFWKGMMRFRWLDIRDTTWIKVASIDRFYGSSSWTFTQALPLQDIVQKVQSFVSSDERLFDETIIKCRQGAYPTLDPAVLTYRSLADLNYLSINSIAFLRDAKGVISSIKPFVKLLKNPLNLKNWANARLTSRYGITLTIADTKELVTAYDRWSNKRKKAWKHPFSTIRSKGHYGPGSAVPEGIDVPTDLDITVHQKVYYHSTTDSVSKFVDYLRKVDLFPSATNIWDLIPYSFVVDWFLGIDKYAKKIDADFDKARLPLSYALYSIKVQKLYSEETLGFHAATSLCTKKYVRYVENTLPSPKLPPDWSPSSATIANRVIDGVALLIQRRKK